MSRAMNTITAVAGTLDVGREVAIAAALIADSVERAREGDGECILWLQLCSPRYLAALAGDDPSVLHRRLLTMAGVSRRLILLDQEFSLVDPDQCHEDVGTGRKPRDVGPVMVTPAGTEAKGISRPVFCIQLELFGLEV